MFWSLFSIELENKRFIKYEDGYWKLKNAQTLIIWIIFPYNDNSNVGQTHHIGKADPSSWYVQNVYIREIKER